MPMAGTLNWQHPAACGARECAEVDVRRDAAVPAVGAGVVNLPCCRARELLALQRVLVTVRFLSTGLP